jgi:putative phosphoesterase
LPVNIAVVGDTHVDAFEKLPVEIVEAMREADWVIHVGDYTSDAVLRGLLKLKQDRFRGVYGNADPAGIRKLIPRKDILSVEGKRIGITHPATGGQEGDIERQVMAEFKEERVDAIVHGHTHDPRIACLAGIWLISPGKGYLEKIYFGAPTSMAILTVGKEIGAEIRKVAY